MADLATVEQALVAQLATTLFPAGGYLPGQYATSAAGLSVKCYRGWPEAANLDGDLANGRAHVSVYPEAGSARNTTRKRAEWFVPNVTAPTLTATPSNSAPQVTFGGTGGAGQVVGISFGGFASPVAYAYRLVSGDTPATVAAAFAGLIAGSSATGAVLTISTGFTVNAIVVADTIALRNVRQQVQRFRVSVWCPSPATRDTVAGLADQAFANMQTANGEITEFLTLPSGEAVRVTYANTSPFDVPSKDRVWRRDLCFMVEYETTVAQAQPMMLFGTPVITPNGNPMPPQTAAILPPPTPKIGAIRWDAWYASDALNSAVAADLSPTQFNYRLPFFATISGGVANIAGNQAAMDAEILAAAGAGLNYWAFLAWPAGAPENTALNLYLGSANQGKLGFCIIEDFSNVYFAGLGYSAELANSIALTAHPGYATVMDGRPLFYMLDTSDADIVYRWGSLQGFNAAVQYIRSQVQAITGKNPYMVVLCPDPVRANTLVRRYGFDAVGAYAVPGAITTPTPYAGLVSTAEAWWNAAVGQGSVIVPPIMTGWNFTPRIITPNSLFGSEVNGSLTAYYQDGTPSAIAAHFGDALAWMAANRSSAPAQTALAYAWNEFDEGGYLCPTYLTGHPAGDNSRLTALAAVLG